MATGYTHPVCDGEITTLPAFAMSCARAFGALIDMRDMPMDAQIPAEIKPSDYSAKKLVEARAKLAKLKAMTPAQAQRAADRSHAKWVKSQTEYEAEKVTQNERLNEMLRRVKAWKPPSKDHQGMKDFMTEQLTSSLHDAKSFQPLPSPMTGKEWLAEEIACVKRDIKWHQKRDREERARAKERTKWLKQLRSSLRHYQ